MKKALVILSGGMDSTTLLYEVVKKEGADFVVAVSFNYNQKHSKELIKATKTCEKLGVGHHIIPLDVLNDVAISSLTRETIDVPEGHYEQENMKQTVVPNRNMVMISLAASYAMSRKILNLYCGVHSGDHAIYPDCRKEYIESLAKTLSLADWNPCNLYAPYLTLDKGDIVIKGKNLGVDYSLTWTCYKGKQKACGNCGSCTERLEAFKKAGVDDPLEYM